MTRRLWLGLLLALSTTAAAATAQTTAEWQDVVRNLRHPNPAERLEAVNRLAAAGYRAAVEPVAPLITDPDDRVQLAAIQAELRFFQADRIGGGGLLGLGSSDSSAQAAFEAGPLLRGAGEAPAVVLDVLLAAVRDANPRVQFDAIHAFGFLAEPPLAADLAQRLQAELDHYDPTIRAATARVIGRLRAASAGGALQAALGDSSPVVRRYATESLGYVREPRAAEALRAQLAGARGDMLPVTLLAIARIGQAADIGLLRARLTDRDATIRRAAIEGLGRAGDRESQPYIQSVLDSDRSDEERAAAAFALHLFGVEQGHVLAPMLVIERVNAQVRDYLFEIGPASVPGIVSTLQVATNGRHRADLVQLIGYLGTPDQVAVIEPLAGDRDERVRRAVASAVARLKR